MDIRCGEFRSLRHDTGMKILMTIMLAAGHLACFMATAAADSTSVKTVTSSTASAPTTTVGFPIIHTLDGGLGVPAKIVGGGARSNYTGFGNRLTQSAPGA